MSRRALILTVSLVSILTVFAVYFGLLRINKNITRDTQAASGSATLTSQAEWEAGTLDNIDSTSVPGSIKINNAAGSTIDIVALYTADPTRLTASYGTYKEKILTNGTSPTPYCPQNSNCTWPYYLPTPPGDGWIKMDLGSIYNINGMHHDNACNNIWWDPPPGFNNCPVGSPPDTYIKFYTSLDGVDWTLQHTLNSTGSHIFFTGWADLTPTFARYFKIESNYWGYDAINGYWYGLESMGVRDASDPSTHTSAATQLDAGSHTTMDWTTFVPADTIPANTSINFRFRTSADAVTWGSYTALTASAASIDIGTLLGATDAAKRYLQVETTLANTNGLSTPTLDAYTASYDYADLDHVTINSTSNQAIAANNNGFPGFVAHAWDATNTEITPATFTWGTTCGTVVSTGDTTAKFYAPASVPSPPTCTVTATTTIGGITKSGTTGITIYSCDIWFYAPAPGQALPTDYRTFTEAVTYYSLLENNGQLNTTVNYTYSDDQGTTFENVGQLGYFTTPNRSRDVTITATASCGGTASVTYSARKQAPEPVVTEPPVTIDPTPELEPTPKPEPEPKPPKPCKKPQAKTCLGPLCFDGDNIYIGKLSIPIPDSNGNKKLKTNDCEIVIDDPISVIIDPTPNDDDQICSGAECLPIPDEGNICIGNQCQSVDGPITIPIENDNGGTICSGGECIPLPKDGDEVCFDDTCFTIDDPISVIIDPGPGDDQFCNGDDCLPIPPDDDKICVNDQCLIVDGPIAITPNAGGDEICLGNVCISSEIVSSTSGGALGLAALLAALALLFSASTNYLSFVSPSQLFSLFVKGREKKHAGGIVYDAASGFPIPGTRIELYRARDKKLQTITFSELSGKFALETPPGEEYFIQVKKEGFEQLSGIEMDVRRAGLAYEPNYFGGNFRPSEAQSLFPMSIPLSATRESDKFSRNIRIFETFSKILRVINIPLLLLGLVFTILVLNHTKHYINYAILAFYIVALIYTITRLLISARTYGTVIDSGTSAPIDLAVVRAISESSGKLIKTSVSNSKGRFALILPKGFYKIMAAKTGLVQSSNITVRAKSNLTPTKQKVQMQCIERVRVTEPSAIIPESRSQTARIASDSNEIVANFNQKQQKFGTTDLANIGVHHLINENEAPNHENVANRKIQVPTESELNASNKPNWELPSTKTPM